MYCGDLHIDTIFATIRSTYLSYSGSDVGLRTQLASVLSPTNLERKNYDEISTPVSLVEKMLATIPENFWKNPQKVLDPCCGKGNFVLGIFDAFYAGLETSIPDSVERCECIINSCIYISDINPDNVDITAYMMSKHVLHKCGAIIPCSAMNTYIGDALTMDIKCIWNISLADITVIGNPPYTVSISLRHSIPIYDKFVDTFIHARFLLFVIPSRWFSGGKGLTQFRKECYHDAILSVSCTKTMR